MEKKWYVEYSLTLKYGNWSITDRDEMDMDPNAVLHLADQQLHISLRTDQLFSWFFELYGVLLRIFQRHTRRQTI